MMKRHLIIFAVAFFMMTILAGSQALAAQPSSKSAVQVSNVALLSATSTSTSDWTDLLSVSIKTANKKDLIMLVSLECALYAKTVGKSKAGTLDTQMASSGVKVRVLVDGATVAEPGEVVFCRKAQTLNTNLATALTSCVDGSDGSIPDGVIQITECTFSDSEIQLILDTMDANAFNFALTDLGVGVHQVKVQALIDINLTGLSTNVEAKAAIGKGSIIVEEVRLVKDADITL